MDGKIVETVYGKKSKYTITRKDNTFRSTQFLIYKDGKYWKSSDSLAEAVRLCS